MTFDALIRHAACAGWKQHAVIGVPADDTQGRATCDAQGVGVDLVRFRPEIDSAPGAGADLDFPVPGMSDVMPYPSTIFSTMGETELEAYRKVWSDRLEATLRAFRPHVIHCHHAWVVATIARRISMRSAVRVPLIVHGHGTALRQQALCPWLVPEVNAACSQADRFAVLHEEHSDAYSEALGIERDRCHVVGAGYAEDVFRPDAGVLREPRSILFAGKISRSKGLDCLLDAVERMRRCDPDLVLRVAGAGSGAEAEELESRMRGLAPNVEMLGRLDQPSLHRELLRSRVFVLPSFFEGLPLVLVEALASGCRLVATDLPGVRQGLAPGLGDALSLVPAPSLATVDRPRESDLPRYIDDLVSALQHALEADPLSIDDAFFRRLEPFSWGAVFRRVESLWLDVIRP